MNYLTALWRPRPFLTPEGIETLNGFVSRTNKRVTRRILDAIPRLKQTQSILQDKFTIMVDEDLKDDPYTLLTYEAIAKADLNIKMVRLSDHGFYRRKWLYILHGMETFGKEILWMDALDTVMCAPFTAAEEAFLSGRELVCEWHDWGAKVLFHEKNGNVVRCYRQPQTSIFLVRGDRLIHRALQSNLDSDQAALTWVLEEDGIFQDSSLDEFLAYSSRGLFNVTDEAHKDLIFTTCNDLWKPKIFHQRQGCE